MILSVNTCCQKIELCLVDGDNTYYDTIPHQRNDSEFLILTLKKLLDSNDLKIKDIKKILCIKGPGSFTAVRIGVIFANTLKNQIDCKLYELNTLEYLSYFIKPEETLLVGAGGQDFYTLDDDKVVLLQKDNLSKEIRYSVDISNKQRSLIEDNLNINSIEYNLLEFTLNWLKNVTSDDVLEINPFYFKEANIDKNNLKKTKSGYFMVFISFVIVLLMTPLMMNIFNNQILVFENYQIKSENLKTRNEKISFENQIYNNSDWYGKFLIENFTDNFDFKQNIINKSLIPQRANQVANPEFLINCQNFELFDYECDSALTSYLFTVPLLNYSDYSYQNQSCDQNQLIDNENSINSECSFNNLKIGKIATIPLFSSSNEFHNQIVNPQENFFKIRFKFECGDLNFECNERIIRNYNNINNWLNHRDISKKIIDLKIVSNSEIYAPNFTFFNLDEGRPLNNQEITLDKIQNPNHNAIRFLSKSNESNFYEIDLNEINFVNIKNTDDELDDIWGLENPFLIIRLINTPFFDSDNQAIYGLDYQILTNKLIGLSKTLIINSVTHENNQQIVDNRFIPVDIEQNSGIVISN